MIMRLILIGSSAVESMMLPGIHRKRDKVVIRPWSGQEDVNVQCLSRYVQRPENIHSRVALARGMTCNDKYYGVCRIYA